MAQHGFDGLLADDGAFSLEQRLLGRHTLYASALSQDCRFAFHRLTEGAVLANSSSTRLLRALPPSTCQYRCRIALLLVGCHRSSRLGQRQTFPGSYRDSQLKLMVIVENPCAKPVDWKHDSNCIPSCRYCSPPNPRVLLSY